MDSACSLNFPEIKEKIKITKQVGLNSKSHSEPPQNEHPLYHKTNKPVSRSTPNQNLYNNSHGKFGEFQQAPESMNLNKHVCKEKIVPRDLRKLDDSVILNNLGQSTQQGIKATQIDNSNCKNNVSLFDMQNSSSSKVVFQTNIFPIKSSEMQYHINYNDQVYMKTDYKDVFNDNLNEQSSDFKESSCNVDTRKSQFPSYANEMTKNIEYMSRYDISCTENNFALSLDKQDLSLNLSINKPNIPSPLQPRLEINQYGNENQFESKDICMCPSCYNNDKMDSSDYPYRDISGQVKENEQLLQNIGKI